MSKFVVSIKGKDVEMADMVPTVPNCIGKRFESMYYIKDSVTGDFVSTGKARLDELAVKAGGMENLARTYISRAGKRAQRAEAQPKAETAETAVA